MFADNQMEQETTIQPQPKPEVEQAMWLVRAKGGDRAAFDQVVQKYQHPIYNLCYRMLGDTLEAEDAAQEVFIRAYFKLNTYDEGRKFSTWLFAIASHYCLDKLKLRRLQLIAWEDAPQDKIVAQLTGQPEPTLIREETSAELYSLLDTLDADYRIPVILKYWHDMSCEEIADILHTSVSAVKSRLFRARRKMAQTVQRTKQIRTHAIPQYGGLASLTAAAP